jgi:hypothetical protein
MDLRQPGMPADPTGAPYLQTEHGLPLGIDASNQWQSRWDEDPLRALYPRQTEGYSADTGGPGPGVDGRPGELLASLANQQIVLKTPGCVCTRVPYEQMTPMDRGGGRFCPDCGKIYRVPW